MASKIPLIFCARAMALGTTRWSPVKRQIISSIERTVATGMQGSGQLDVIFIGNDRNAHVLVSNGTAPWFAVATPALSQLP